jgi:hypothetical protein
LKKKTKNWWQTKEANCHLLHLRQKNNDDEPPGSSSFSTLEGKKNDDERRRFAINCYVWENKKVEDEPPGLSSSSTLEKNKKKMTMSQEARHHLLHLKKKPRDLFFPCIFQLVTLCAQNKRWGRAGPHILQPKKNQH